MNVSLDKNEVYIFIKSVGNSKAIGTTNPLTFNKHCYTIFVSHKLLLLLILCSSHAIKNVRTFLSIADYDSPQ